MGDETAMCEGERKNKKDLNFSFQTTAPRSLDTALTTDLFSIRAYSSLAAKSRFSRVQLPQIAGCRTSVSRAQRALHRWQLEGQTASEFKDTNSSRAESVL